LKKLFTVIGVALFLTACGNQEVTDASTGITTFKIVKAIGGMHGTEANFDKAVARTAERICAGGYQELSRMFTGQRTQQNYVVFSQYEVSVRCV